MKAKFNAFMTLLVIIGLPLGSYLYLKKGFTYRKEALDEMKVERTIDWNDFGLMTAVSSEKVNDPSIIVYAPFNGDGSEGLAEDLNNLHRQYGERSEIRFTLGGDTELRRSMIQQISQKLIKELYISDAQLPQMFTENKLYLIDPDGGIRGEYDRKRIEEMQKLVKHISILLPLEKKKQIQLVRKKETRDEQG